MRKIFRAAALLAALACAGCAAQKTAVNPPAPAPANGDHSITLTWQQTFADSPACSSTVTASCISGFSEGYVSGSSQEQLHTDTTAVCTGSAQPETCTSTFNGVLPIGVVTFYVNTAYVDQNGAACSGAAAGTTGGAADCEAATDTTANPPTIGADAATNLACSAIDGKACGT